MSINWMDLQAFVEEGYLQEVNRQFFHPLGLALAVEIDKAGKVVGFKGVWDYRNDPEGIAFDDLSPEKAHNVAKEREYHLVERETLGYPDGIQPIEVE